MMRVVSSCASRWSVMPCASVAGWDLKSAVGREDPNRARNAHFLRHRPDRGGAAQDHGYAERAGGRQATRPPGPPLLRVRSPLRSCWSAPATRAGRAMSPRPRRTGGGARPEANGVSEVTRAVLAAVFAGAVAAKLAFRKDRLRAPMPWVDDFSQGTVRLI